MIANTIECSPKNQHIKLSNKQDTNFDSVILEHRSSHIISLEPFSLIVKKPENESQKPE